MDAIRCPHCRHTNTYTSTRCEKCKEPLPRSTKGETISQWMSLVAPEIRRPLKAPPKSPPATSLAFDWRPSSPWRRAARRYKKVLIFFAGLILVGITVIRVWEPRTESGVEGSRLGHRFFEYSTYRYFVDMRKTVNIWAAKHGQLTPVWTRSTRPR